MNVGVVHNRWTNSLCAYRCLLKNRLLGKAAEPSLANISVTATQYTSSTLTAFTPSITLYIMRAGKVLL